MKELCQQFLFVPAAGSSQLKGSYASELWAWLRGLLDYLTLNIFWKGVKRRKCIWQFKSDHFFEGMLNRNSQVWSICLNLSRRASV